MSDFLISIAEKKRTRVASLISARPLDQLRDEAYRKREWDQAIDQFSALIHHPSTQGDGPSLFYVTLCEQYKANPPRATWTGVVRVAQK